MAKDPAILFYTSDFLSGCIDLDMQERGQYITLLCAQHQKGRLSEKTIRLLVGSVSVSVLSKFKKDESGNFFNERMENEAEKRKNFVETRKENGNKGGRPPKKPNGYPNGYPKNNLMENENDNEDINSIESKNFGKSENLLLIPEMFEIFKLHNPNYPGTKDKDYRPLFQIASFLCEQGKLPGSPDLHREQVVQAWEPICKIIKADKFYSQKSLSTISNHIQEILQISLHGKSNGKIQYGSSERAKEFDRLFAERYPNG